MPMFTVPRSSWAPIVAADNAINTTLGFVDVVAGTTSLDRIIEVFIAGEATASTVNSMCVRRLGTLGVGALSGAAAVKANGRSQAPLFTSGNTYATTMSTPAAAPSHILNLSLNTFGGIVRWVAAPGEELWVVGAATVLAADGTACLGSTGGTGLVSTHMIVEEL